MVNARSVRVNEHGARRLRRLAWPDRLAIEAQGPALGHYTRSLTEDADLEPI